MAFDFLSKLLGGLGNMFGGGGNQAMSGVKQGLGTAISTTGNAPNSSWGGGGGGGGLGGMFSNILGAAQRHPNITNAIGGLGTVFGSQLIGNPKMPAMPESFNQYQQMAQQGGPPIAQSSQQYLQSLMSGQNTAANDAATRSLDLNYQEQLRQLNAMYKSLRPGTDPTTDSTYQRDLALLNRQYAESRADTLARQQMGAAQQGAQMGQQQMGYQQNAMEAQINQIASQWGMNYAQKQALRNQLMGIGGDMITGPITMNMMKGMPMFAKMFGG